MARVSKAGRFTEILEEEIGKKLLESQAKFHQQWKNATDTNSATEQLNRITMVK